MLPCTRRLQSAPSPETELEKYSVEAAGPPLMFSVQGTHGRKYSRWVFPDPSKYIQSHTLGQGAFDKVCHRFALVREDLQKALVHQVEEIIPELLQMNYESDLSGLSGDSLPKQLWVDFSQLLETSDRYRHS
jgi:hypothetical protein